jgi:predicted nucleic acid-binding Zn ribbon protein
MVLISLPNCVAGAGFTIIFPPPTHTHLLYIICRICSKRMCSISTSSWMSYAQRRNSYTLFFFHLGIILILVLVFCSGLSDRDRTVYRFSSCAVSLLSSRFTASALVRFSNFLKYLVFPFLFHRSLWSFVDLHGSCGCLCIKVRPELIGVLGNILFMFPL